jgi:hypothetical protein
MRFTLTVELGGAAIKTGETLAELLVRIAPTVERCVGADLADCIGTVRDLDGKKVGTWTCIKSKVREASSASWPSKTINNSEHLTVRDINAHLSDGSHACYVHMEGERIRIRHARNVNGQLKGKIVNRPGEWIAIPPDATVELLD